MMTYHFNTNDEIVPEMLHDTLVSVLGDVFVGLGWTNWLDKPKDLVIHTTRNLTTSEQELLSNAIEAHEA